jgi:rod shape determining protein RodA
MRQLWQEWKMQIRKADMVLLVLCLSVSAFGCLIIASTNNYRGFSRYVIVQLVAIALGVGVYFLATLISLDFLAGHRIILTGVCCAFLLLLIPFGTDLNSGNRSWLDLPFLPFYIQPAEICKIFYIIVGASAMNARQNRLSSFSSILFYALYLGIPVGLNMYLSKDAGVSLIFVFIFIGIAFAGGIKLIWFLLAGGGITVIVPILWNNFMREDQRKRFEILWNPDIDPQGIDERYHLVRSLKSLTGGGMLGQGLFNGNRTQVGALPSQHTDFIFSAIGEELGYVGCILVLVMLFAVVARCIWVGCRSQDYMRRLVCFGAASALIFQICVNVGMCMGVMPVIGLTLPLISYGGSSTVTIYAMLGLVSGVYARPAPKSYERYIQPPL